MISSSLAYDGQRLLLFKYKDGQSDIYESKLNGTEWSEPKLKMSKVVNTDANEPLLLTTLKNQSLFHYRWGLWWR